MSQLLEQAANAQTADVRKNITAVAAQEKSVNAFEITNVAAIPAVCLESCEKTFSLLCLGIALDRLSKKHTGI